MNRAGSARNWTRNGLYYLLLVLLALPFLLPILWAVAIAVRLPHPIVAPLGKIGAISFDNFRIAWQAVDFPLFVFNSILVGSVSTVATLLSSSVVGYGFAIFQGRGRSALFGLMLTSIMIPSAVTLIPMFILSGKLGWINTYIPLLLPRFFANAFYVFLFHQFFRSIPIELFESAELEGCNPLLTYWYIGLPLVRPALAAVALFAFVGSWNDFLEPLIYINSNKLFTVSLGLSLFQGLYYTQLEYLMSASLLTLLPVVVLFFLTQRYFVQGIQMDNLYG